MTKKLLSALIASLFTAAPAFGQSADDPMRVQGTGTLGGIYNNTSARDKAQLELYQDLGNGVMSNVGVQGRNSTTWFQGYGENFGRNRPVHVPARRHVRRVQVRRVHQRHPAQFSTSAFTPFNGSGGNLLTATFPLTGITAIPPTGWNGFTLGYDRRDWGGYAEWQKNSPWYFRVDGNEVKFNGTRPGSASNGTSPGNGYTDLAFPQDFKTTNWGVEGGYQSTKATFAVRWDYSKFENSNETLRWTNPFFGPTVNSVATTSNLLDTTYLAPANTFNKFTLAGNYRDLPWQSVISARYTYAKTTSDTPIALTALNTNGVYNNTLPDTPNFNGEHVNQSFQLAWTAMPAANWNTRVYYYWTKLDNKSDLVEFGNAPATAARLRPGLRKPRRGRHSDADGRQLRYRALQLHEEQRRLRRLVEVCAGPEAGLRLRLPQHRPDARRLRQVAHEQAVGRVQEHDVRHVVGTAEVPVPEARLGSQLHQRPASQRRREQPELPAAVHVGIRPAEQHHEPGEAESRLEPDGRTSACRSRPTGPRSTTTR